ncbi:hypothetical protein FA13DRAFT_1734886 [Coprinellus micaceus]|uniref:Uncharacterized protein n=1 Tax=Coprinellus micaceus TaxID=71717 RepID=A0A4Y7T5C1_COPMI|nr:hypothetical protein FA13DRAFT_1734886 [Coprinellus micaceus]
MAHPRRRRPQARNGVHPAAGTQTEGYEPAVGNDEGGPAPKNGRSSDTRGTTGGRSDRALKNEPARSKATGSASGSGTPKPPSQDATPIPVATAHGQRSGGGKRKNRPCLEFRVTGKCEKGDACEYPHSTNETQVVEPDKPTQIRDAPIPMATAQGQRSGGGLKSKKNKPCLAFRELGRCEKGNACEYNHNTNGRQVVEPDEATQSADQKARISAREAARKAGRERKRREEEARRREEEKSQEEERIQRERLERERRERERLERERQERERLEKEPNAGERERLERERLERERLERERLERERLERERLERERLERERLEGERREKERLEKERRETERLEKERLEAERLKRERAEAERRERERRERERLERERLEAERLERERVEAERTAHELAQATAARRAEEREHKRKERDKRLAREREKVLQEQEEKRRREAKVTRQSVVQGSNLVTFGPGLEVQRIVPGFDLCKVVVRNLPSNASDKQIADIFEKQGLDDTMFKLLESREERGSKVAKVLTRREEAEAMALGELQFRNNLLSFEVEDNIAWGSMKVSGADTNTPSIVMIATYETVEEARRKAQELNRRQFGDRRITANMNQRPNGRAARSWVEASVKIGNLPLGTEPFDIQTMAGTFELRSIKSNDYDGTMFLEQLKVYLRLDGYVADSLTIIELQAASGRMKGTARFPSQESLKRAADRLNRGMPNWPKIRVLEQHQYCISISNAQYRAQKAQWDSMTETARGKKAFIRINERRNGQVFVNVEGSEEKEVGELKVRVESLVAGERLGAEHWHNTYAHAAKALFDRVKEETTVLVTVDRRFQCLRLFGSGASIAQAKNIIRQDVDRLEFMEYKIPIERRSVRFFVATGLPILQEALGEDNVTLDVGSQQCSLKLRGGDDAIRHAQKLVEEAVTAARGGLPVPARRGADNEGSPCPICFDTPTHPEVLSCGHSCCEPCLRHYISSAATSDTFPLVCMGNGATCNTPISVPIIQRYLTQQRFDVLLDAVFASYLQTNSKKFRYCTTPDCTQIYQCDTGKQVHQCPACFSCICSSCNEEAHEGMTCEQRRLQRDPVEQDRLNNEWAQANNIKRCPMCSVMTEKTAGCNHMTCRCGGHWCWTAGLDQGRRRRGAAAPREGIGGERRARVAEQVRLGIDPIEADRRRRQEEADERWMTRVREAEERERERRAEAHRERQRQMAEEWIVTDGYPME